MLTIEEMRGVASRISLPEPFIVIVKDAGTTWVMPKGGATPDAINRGQRIPFDVMVDTRDVVAYEDVEINTPSTVVLRRTNIRLQLTADEYIARILMTALAMMEHEMLEFSQVDGTPYRSPHSGVVRNNPLYFDRRKGHWRGVIDDPFWKSTKENL